MKMINDIGIQIPTVYLPKKSIDLKKWAVIACDQFTAEPQYWQQVEEQVGAAPSTLKLIFPEVYLDKPGAPERMTAIGQTMTDYLRDGVLLPHDGMVYVERSVAGKTRHGLMLCLDLECYDYRSGSASLIRATEGTIVDRLPPRIKIREQAALELPHILVLIDDQDHTVIQPLTAAKAGFAPLYDFELMQGGGHLAGYAVTDAAQQRVVDALRALAQPERFAARYGVGPEQPVLLFAMGDGNHSLATAKAIWEKNKARFGLDHPSRFALAEIDNVHDQALEFEAIHRLLLGCRNDMLTELKTAFGSNLSYTEVASAELMRQRVDASQGPRQAVGFIGGGQAFGVIEIDPPTSNLPVGTLQTFLDQFLKGGGAQAIDYVHGADVLERLAWQSGNAGFYFAGMHKSELFKTVILEGALPHKTFSLGQAREKRYYMEARKIS
ncbi:DUF1015 domain-containing protein [Rhodoferax sp.]|uniref:DUF1015 domain-containing protein n=1 Tax=Rhodoferax sp. TaxID=50421 RepID=UPI0026358644|nr:DUF1015 domain-containing protein [Rhodoferax sp.]MDD2917878.1 DUF1015 domain-containing protein [Rhodoferax sp.]